MDAAGLEVALDDIATCPEITQAVVARVDNQVTQVVPSLRTQSEVSLDGGRRGRWEDDGITTIATANGYGDRNEESAVEVLVDVEASAVQVQVQNADGQNGG